MNVKKHLKTRDVSVFIQTLHLLFDPHLQTHKGHMTEVNDGQMRDLSHVSFCVSKDVYVECLKTHFLKEISTWMHDHLLLFF